MKHVALIALCCVLVALAGVWLHASDSAAPVIEECTCLATQH